MFWGLIMEPGRCYTQTVKVSFHVSMAALDLSNSSDDPAQVMCVFEGRNYLLCTLTKDDKLQCPLDLNFEEGTKVSFATNGKSHVHLTGYLTAFDDNEDAEEEEEEVEIEFPKKKSAKKRNNALEASPEPAKKKVRTAKLNALASVATATQEEAEEESSDSDFDINKMADDSITNKEEETDDDSAEEVEEEDDEDDEDDGEEEEDEDEAEESGEEEESEDEEEEAPKQNGIPKKQPASTPLKQKKEPAKKVIKGGIIIQDLKEGTGSTANPGKFVHVYYEGRLKSNNKVFDATKKGPGFSFRLGKSEVIKGWDLGVAGMKVGGKRRIICPPQVAYGAKGSPPVIPPNSTLVFDVELKKVS